MNTNTETLQLQSCAGPEHLDEYWLERLTSFYSQYNPTKISALPNLLTKYKNQELLLITNLVKKYGPEPPSTTTTTPPTPTPSPFTMSIIAAKTADQEAKETADAIAAVTEAVTTTTCKPHPQILQSDGVPNLSTTYFSLHNIIDLATGLGASSTASSTATTTFSTKNIAPTVDYIHYMTRGENDLNWGCCYRCLQMMLQQHFKTTNEHIVAASVTTSTSTSTTSTTPQIPTILQIQQMLITLQRMQPNKLGSTSWIEPPDCAAVLEHIYNIPSTQHLLVDIGTNNTSSALLALQQFWDTMDHHFSTKGPQTPIVCDDVTYAYVVAGVAVATAPVPNLPLTEACDTSKNDLLTKAWVLLFDPHSYEHVATKDYVDGTAFQYESRSPANKIVPGGARWVPYLSLFWNRKKWMVTMPQVQPGQQEQQEGETKDV